MTFSYKETTKFMLGYVLKNVKPACDGRDPYLFTYLWKVGKRQSLVGTHNSTPACVEINHWL